MWGVVTLENNVIGEPLKDPKVLSHNSTFLQGMASCHSLSLIEGELGGDPLDIKVIGSDNLWSAYIKILYFQMFQATGWILLDPANNKCGYSVTVKPMSVSTYI